jgi:hypothetical protein
MILVIAVIYIVAWMLIVLSVLCACLLTWLLAFAVYNVLTSKYYQWRPWTAALYCLLFAALIFKPMIHVGMHVVVFSLDPPPWFRTMTMPLVWITDVSMTLVNACVPTIREILNGIEWVLSLLSLS